MKIEDWRAEIDAIDQNLLRLMNRRAQLAVEVGALKKAAGIPILDPDRERDVLRRMCDENHGPLDERAVVKLFRRIIYESKKVETRMTEAPAAAQKELL